LESSQELFLIVECSTLIQKDKRYQISNKLMDLFHKESLLSLLLTSIQLST
jgi:hypothetical protein